MSTKAYERTLATYGKEQREKLDPKIRKLIAQASYDLWYGPLTEEEDYPGFVSACRQIGIELDSMIEAPIYIDDNTEYWTTVSPEEQEDECPEFWYRVERDDCIRAIVGCKELVEYVR